MSAEKASTAAPTWAVKTWCDQLRVFIELPSRSGPVIFAYPRTSDGWQKMLAQLTAKHKRDGHGEVYHKMPSTTPDKTGFSEADRQNVRDVLKRMGIT